MRLKVAMKLLSIFGTEAQGLLSCFRKMYGISEVIGTCHILAPLSDNRRHMAAIRYSRCTVVLTPTDSGTKYHTWLVYWGDTFPLYGFHQLPVAQKGFLA